MKIYHYIFGIPPLRGGGTIKYAMDLAETQSNLGHDVSIIYPGAISKFQHRQRICFRKSFGKVGIWELMNPLPVSLVTGIKKPKFFMQQGDLEVYRDFFQREKIDVLHVHSLMGVYREFFQAAKENQVKLIFTTHDYFGLCPKTNLLYKGQICSDVCWENCRECCKDAESISTLIKRQSHWFQWFIKYKQLVRFKKWLCSRVLKKKTYLENIEQVQLVEEDDNLNDAYENLREYYLAEFKLMDLILYNSTVTKKHYEKRFAGVASIVTGVMHSGIEDHRRLRNYGKKVKFAYLGYPVEYKGYFVLLNILDELYQKYPTEFQLNIYMNELVDQKPYIYRQDMFGYQQLAEVYSDMDVLIVPSLCAETYSFIVHEALSFAVPVVVTENVGASDLIRKHEEVGVIVEADEESLKNVLDRIIQDKTILSKMNRKICSADLNFDYLKYVKQIMDIYDEVKCDE